MTDQTGNPTEQAPAELPEDFVEIDLSASAQEYLASLL